MKIVSALVSGFLNYLPVMLTAFASVLVDLKFLKDGIQLGSCLYITYYLYYTPSMCNGDCW